MRILTIFLNNLNSLTGAWRIDLSDPVFIHQGLFAIVGPTGAGKTTILDAICLALYGRTPRLAKITHQENAIMSKHTAKCAAEVSFTTSQGYYRCSWHQQRAHKKTSGKLQQPYHEISDASTGIILANTLSQTAILVEQVTGMNFERFTRSMMLAQGKFAAFLHASSNERAPILEQITGTEVYSQISMMVFERYKKERDHYDSLKKNVGQLACLTQAQEQQLIADLNDAKTNGLNLQQTISHYQQQLTWLIELNQTRITFDALTVEWQQWCAQHTEFLQHQHTLARANHALELSATFSQLNAQRLIAQDKDQVLATLVIQQLQAQEQQVAEEKNLAVIQKQYDDFQLDHQKKLTLLNQARAIDNQLLLQQPLIDVLDQQLNQDYQLIQQLIQQLTQDWVDFSTKTKPFSSKKTNLPPTLAMATGTSWDMTAVNTMLTCYQTEFNHQQQTLVSRQQQINQHRLSLIELQKKCDDLLDQQTLIAYQQRIHAHQSRQTALNHAIDLSIEHQKTRDYLISLSKEQQALKVSILNADTILINQRQVQSELKQTLVALEQQQTTDHHLAIIRQLQITHHANKPCLLCGAPQSLKQSISDKPNNQNRLTTEHLKATLVAVENDLAHWQSEVISGKKTISYLTKQLSQQHQHEQTLHSELMQCCHELGLAGDNQSIAQSLSQLKQVNDKAINALKIKFDSAEIIVQKHHDLAQTVALQEADVHELTQVIQVNLTKLDFYHQQCLDISDKIIQKEQQQLTFRLEINALKLKRQQLCADDHLDKIEQALKLKHAGMLQCCAIAEKKCMQQEHKCTQLQALKHTSTHELLLLKQQLTLLEQQWQKALKQRGFSDEHAFLTAQLTETQRKNLDTTQQAYQQQKTIILTRKSEIQQRLTQLQNRPLTTFDQQQLTQIIDELQTEQQQLQQHIGTINQQLADDCKQKDNALALKNQLKQQTQTLEQWEMLSGLIGSADGKKFRNFAQGLTLETVVTYANQYLQHMNARYLLVVDKVHALGLNIIDYYQAGVIRTVKNLSGGESFIISLSLALGLAKMVSHRMRIDSLFLDEGFGSLDENALLLALDALATLPETNKMIGIISHVPLLKDWIHLQIEVTPVQKGQSIISGPGCYREKLS